MCTDLCTARNHQPDSFGVVGVAPWVRALQEIILQESTEALRLCSIINHAQNLHL